MIYREFGKTGVKTSLLGFGCMRFPEIEKNGKFMVDDDKAGPLLKRAYDLGVNYFDTAWGYCHEDSQRATGVAVKGFRDKINIATKLPMWLVKEEKDTRYYLEESLKRLGTDYIDFYHMHAVNKGHFETIKTLNILENLAKAKEEGLIKHVCLSFHDTPDVMMKIIDMGMVESILCQYNLIDRTNEEAMAYAASKGVGIVVMGPVGGGNLALGDEKFVQQFNTKAQTATELAFRFVFGNPAVSCAISGMTTEEMLIENVKYANEAGSITEDEIKNMKAANEQLISAAKIYCTGCNYCDVCPEKIQPSFTLKTYNSHKVWGLTDAAKKRFAELADHPEWSAMPDKCIECGRCVEKCPQNINIPEALKIAAAELR